MGGHLSFQFKGEGPLLAPSCKVLCAWSICTWVRSCGKFNGNVHQTGQKPVPVPKKAEVLVRIDAVAICATDLEIIYHGPPAFDPRRPAVQQKLHARPWIWARWRRSAPASTSSKIGQRVAVEIHAGCGQCKRCREGMYTSCHNYGLNYGDVDKGHRANGFTTDGGFCEYQVNNINTLVALQGRDVGRGGHARRHRRHGDVRAHRTRRAGRRRERSASPAPARSG